MAIFSDITDSGGTGNINWGHIGGDLSNQTDLKNALDGKANVDGSNATFPHIVESFVSSDGLSWYRKYSDGWVEQGGMIGGSYNNNGNINFLVPFLDTKYIVNFANYTNDTGSIVNKRNICLNGYSATGISFISSDFVICWEAKGYFQ